MKLHYCLKCRRIVDAEFSIKKQDHYFCPACEAELMYFGRESVELSPKKLIADYDKSFSIEPESEFKGKGTIYRNPVIEMSILE